MENQVTLYKLLERNDISEEVKDIITNELKKIEKVQKILMENESKYRMLIQTIPDIVYSLNKNGIITFVNEAVKQLGYSPTDLIGKHFSDILHPEDVEKASSAHVLKKYRGEKTGDENSPKLFDERRTRDRKTSNLEVRILSRFSGTKTGLISVTTQVESSGVYNKVPDENNKEYLGTIGVIKDITEYKKVKEKLKKKDEKIEYLEKFLRVCASCHKIHKPKTEDSQQENWIQMEVFISNKTSTTFSHGYCPQCYKIARQDLRKHLQGLNKKTKT